MKATLCWLLLVFIAESIINALTTRLPHWLWGLEPSAMIIVFLAARRELITLLLIASCLAFMHGSNTLAPSGLHQVAFLVPTIVLYLTTGHFGPTRLLFGFMTVLLQLSYETLLYVLVIWQQPVQRIGWWQQPDMLWRLILTFILACSMLKPMLRLERYLQGGPPRDLLWH